MHLLPFFETLDFVLHWVLHCQVFVNLCLHTCNPNLRECIVYTDQIPSPICIRSGDFSIRFGISNSFITCINCEVSKIHLTSTNKGIRPQENMYNFTTTQLPIFSFLTTLSYPRSKFSFSNILTIIYWEF